MSYYLRLFSEVLVLGNKLLLARISTSGNEHSGRTDAQCLHVADLRNFTLEST